MKTYTKEEVEQIIEETVTISVNGVMEWINKDTDIVDSETKRVIENCEIELKPGELLNNLVEKYIYPKLRNILKTT
jgi:hypothetical protein